MSSIKRRGQAWVVFDHVDAAQKALSSMQSFPFCGKPMVCSMLLPGVSHQHAHCPCRSESTLAKTSQTVSQRRTVPSKPERSSLLVPGSHPLVYHPCTFPSTFPLSLSSQAPSPVPRYPQPRSLLPHCRQHLYPMATSPRASVPKWMAIQVLPLHCLARYATNPPPTYPLSCRAGPIGPAPRTPKHRHAAYANRIPSV
jgi:RNA recognition motif-containing protein